MARHSSPSALPAYAGSAPSVWFAGRDESPVAPAGHDGDPFGPPPGTLRAPQWTEDQLPWNDRDDLPSPRFPGEEALFSPLTGIPVVEPAPVAPRGAAERRPRWDETGSLPRVDQLPASARVAPLPHGRVDEYRVDEYEAPAGLTGPIPVVRGSGPVPHRPIVSLAGPKAMRRGVAAVVVTGGAMSLMGAAVPAVLDDGQTLLSAATGLATMGAQPSAPVTVLAPALAPVSTADEPEVLADAAVLVRAAEMHQAEVARVEAERLAAEEAARVAAEQEAARIAEEQAAAERRASIGADCELDDSGIGAVKSHVREAAQFLGCGYDVDTIYGVAGRAGTSDHPSGRALDFMVDRATGDQLAQCALDNMDELGISYVIWEQQINTGSGWELMEDRGGVTANHFDHVHISFDGAGSGQPTTC